MRYETVVWDWNGTLLDDVTLAMGIVNDILRDHQLEAMTTDRYREIFDFPVQHYYERAGMDFTEVSFEVISERFCQAFEAQVHTAGLFSDARAALAAVEDAGIRQFLLSATEHEFLLRMVTSLDLAETFHDIRGMPDGLARGKIEAGLDLIESCRIDPGSAVLVGDTRHDWEVANALGMDCLLVATGHQSADRLAATGCPVLECAGDVAAYLGEPRNAP